MAHFAKIGLDNIVLEVVIVDNIDTMNRQGIEDEEIGIEFLKKLTGHETWKKCSYNTQYGRHTLGGTPFRKNYPGPGWFYNSEIDGFVPQKPHDSWILNETTGWWDPPVAYPEDMIDYFYHWDDENQTWIKGDKRESSE